ncbi:MAG: FliM/FliN family flagellar motor switch protein [Solirubrobacteraceae bacterium]
MRTVDFTRPTKFTSDHQRRIERALEAFCVTAGTRLSAELRGPIELEAIDTTQGTWTAAQALLPPGALAVTIDVQPIGTRMLLTAEQSFVLTALECLLGGGAERPPRERRLTEIDWMLTRRFLESIVAQLSLVWQDLSGGSLHSSVIEHYNDTGQIASVSEPTLVVVFESRINKLSSALWLMIPWIAIEPVAERVAGHERPNAADDAVGSRAIEQAMASVPVTFRAEVAATQLAVDEILALEPGSIVRLGGRAADGVALYAENIQLGLGHPGSSGTRRAVQILQAEGTQT